MLTPRALAAALGLPPPTDEQAAVIAAPARFHADLVAAAAAAGKGVFCEKPMGLTLGEIDRAIDAARAAGAAPVRAGDPGYGRHLDRDGDGVGCEWTGPGRRPPAG